MNGRATMTLDEIRRAPGKATRADVIALLATIDLLIDERDQARRDADEWMNRAQQAHRAARALAEKQLNEGNE